MFGLIPVSNKAVKTAIVREVTEVKWWPTTRKFRDIAN